MIRVEVRGPQGLWGSGLIHAESFSNPVIVSAQVAQQVSRAAGWVRPHWNRRNVNRPDGLG